MFEKKSVQLNQHQARETLKALICLHGERTPEQARLMVRLNHWLQTAKERPADSMFELIADEPTPKRESRWTGGTLEPLGGDVLRRPLIKKPTK